MQLTQVTNVSGDIEYINVELITNISVEVTGGDNYYHVELSGRGSVAIAATDPVILALLIAAI